MGLLARIFGSTQTAPQECAVPPGILLYAIGDIHGRADLFEQLLRKIDDDRASRSCEECVLILLGDLVDRGPDSDKVVERALSLETKFDHFHHLTGNHEECMLAALSGDVRAIRYFSRIGGDATIRSYINDDEQYAEASFEQLADLFMKSVPETHIEFLRQGEDIVRYGDYAFVHAGVRPGIALDQQSTSDLRWIREDFLSATEHFGARIVHGHTISEQVEVRLNRIGIDTGAYCDGALTALALEGNQVRVMQAYC